MITYIHPKGNHKTVGPYTPGVVFDPTKGKLLFVSGQLPIDPQTGSKVSSDIRLATKLCLENVGRVLEEAGSDFHHVLRVEVFLHDMDDIASMNEVYETFFTKGSYPARQTFQSVIHALIEISCIAVVPL